MILLDTSAWIELLNSKIKIQLNENILFSICITPPVLQEVLQGISSDPYRKELESSLESLKILDKNVPYERYIEASEIYALGKRKGYTIRSSVDCLISAIAIAHDIKIIHKDRDFENISKYSKLKQEYLSDYLEVN